MNESQRKEIRSLSVEELVAEYEETIIYRHEEKQHGQVTPWLLNYKEELKDEIVHRMNN